MKKKNCVYESIYLLRPNFTQQEITAKTKYYQEIITKFGSGVKVNSKGKRTLSYPIKGCDSANYIQMIYQGNDKLLQNLNKEIGRDESILRHIITCLSAENLTELKST